MKTSSSTSAPKSSPRQLAEVTTSRTSKTSRRGSALKPAGLSTMKPDSALSGDSETLASVASQEPVKSNPIPDPFSYPALSVVSIEPAMSESPVSPSNESTLTDTSTGEKNVSPCQLDGKNQVPRLRVEVGKTPEGMKRITVYPNSTVEEGTGKIIPGELIGGEGGAGGDDEDMAGVHVEPAGLAEVVIAGAIKEVHSALVTCQRLIQGGKDPILIAKATILIAVGQAQRVRKALRGMKLRGRYAAAKHVFLTMGTRLDLLISPPEDERADGWVERGLEIVTTGNMALSTALSVSSTKTERIEAVRNYCG